jgi:hypothetical protein
VVVDGDCLVDVCGEDDKNSVRWVVGGLGALAFLALCKVGFVTGFCVPCNVLKIAWGRVGKVMDA